MFTSQELFSIIIAMKAQVDRLQVEYDAGQTAGIALERGKGVLVKVRAARKAMAEAEEVAA